MLARIPDLAVTGIAIAAVLILICIAVFSLVKDKKDHKGTCTGNCATCGMGCSCGKKK